MYITYILCISTRRGGECASSVRKSSDWKYHISYINNLVSNKYRFLLNINIVITIMSRRVSLHCLVYGMDGTSIYVIYMYICVNVAATFGAAEWEQGNEGKNQRSRSE